MRRREKRGEEEEEEEEEEEDEEVMMKGIKARLDTHSKPHQLTPGSLSRFGRQ